MEKNENLSDETVETVKHSGDELKEENEVKTESINQIINAFKSQEDEIKEKLKNKIENKANASQKEQPFNIDEKNRTPNSVGESVGNISASNQNSSHNNNFEITGDSSKLATNSLNNEDEVEDIYLEDLVTIAERAGDNNFVLRHVNRATLSELTEDKDYTILLEWNKLIPDDAKVEDIDTIFKNGLEDFTVNLMNKKELLFNSLEIRKDEWVEGLQEDKKEYKSKSELEKSKSNVLDEQVVQVDGSALSISDILSQRDNISLGNEVIDFNEDFIGSSIEDDLEGLSDFFGLDKNENEVISQEENITINSILSLDNLESKTSEELLKIKESLNEQKTVLMEQKHESSEKAKEYDDKAEEIDKILKGHALRTDGSLYIGEDFFKNYSVEQRGEVLKEFTFKAFDDFNTQAVQQIEENIQINAKKVENENENNLNEEQELGQENNKKEEFYFNFKP